MKLWAFGRYCLKLSESEFWALTPAQYKALVEQYIQERELWDYRIGLICAVFANANRDRKKKPQPFTPQDFMPQYGPKRKQTPHEMLAKVKSLHRRFVKKAGN